MKTVNMIYLPKAFPFLLGELLTSPLDDDVTLSFNSALELVTSPLHVSSLAGAVTTVSLAVLLSEVGRDSSTELSGMEVSADVAFSLLPPFSSLNSSAFGLTSPLLVETFKNKLLDKQVVRLLLQLLYLLPTRRLGKL